MISDSRVLELLERTHLELGRCRLRSKPDFFLRERIDAPALGLRRHLGGCDLKNPRKREAARALLRDRPMHGAFECGKHGFNVLGGNVAHFGDVSNEA